MKLCKLKKIPYYSLACEIHSFLRDKGLPLSSSQYNLLSNYLESISPLYKYKQEKVIKPAWRLTAPVYFIVVFFMFLFMPVKWMLTGRLYYKMSDNLIAKWSKNLGF